MIELPIITREQRLRDLGGRELEAAEGDGGVVGRLGIDERHHLRLLRLLAARFPSVPAGLARRRGGK